MQDWLTQLRALSPDLIYVDHDPPTKRYERAAARLAYLLRECAWIGVRSWDLDPEAAVEIAVWAPPPDGRNHGLYACFRLFHDDGDAYLSQLFAFYDGRDSSPGFRSLSKARAYARFRGFNESESDA